MAFESIRLEINLKYKIPPKTLDATIKARAIYAFVSKENSNPFSTGMMAEKRYFPRKIEGTIVTTNNTNKTFVAVFILLLCNNIFVNMQKLCIFFLLLFTLKTTQKRRKIWKNKTKSQNT